MRTRPRRAWVVAAAVGVLLTLITVAVFAGARWLNGPDRDYAVGTWRSESGTVVRLYADGTVRGEKLPAEGDCSLPLDDRVPYSASGTWEPGLIDSVGPGVILTVTAEGKERSCYTHLVYLGKPWDEQLVFDDGPDRNPMTKD